MSIRHSVYILSSPRPRVGKTLLSRLLIDYHKHEGREFGAFDLNSDDHTLEQFAHDDVTAANIGSVKGQMALFDSLVSEQGGGKVVDVGGDAYKNFFDVAYRIGLVEEAHKRDIAPVILFIVSSDKQAADAYRTKGSARITATGHTDTSGPEAYNMALSLRRANTVKDALVRDGVPATAIAVVGRGEQGLLVQTADGVREPQNRRVEIVIQ